MYPLCMHTHFSFFNTYNLYKLIVHFSYMHAYLDYRSHLSFYSYYPGTTLPASLLSGCSGLDKNGSIGSYIWMFGHQEVSLFERSRRHSLVERSVSPDMPGLESLHSLCLLPVDLHVYLCTVCMQYPWRLEQGIWSLELELQIVVSHPIGLGN